MGVGKNRAEDVVASLAISIVIAAGGALLMVPNFRVWGIVLVSLGIAAGAMVARRA